MNAFLRNRPAVLLALLLVVSGVGHILQWHPWSSGDQVVITAPDNTDHGNVVKLCKEPRYTSVSAGDQISRSRTRATVVTYSEQHDRFGRQTSATITFTVGPHQVVRAVIAHRQAAEGRADDVDQPMVLYAGQSATLHYPVPKGSDTHYYGGEVCVERAA